MMASMILTLSFRDDKSELLFLKNINIIEACLCLIPPMAEH